MLAHVQKVSVHTCAWGMMGRACTKRRAQAAWMQADINRSYLELTTRFVDRTKPEGEGGGGQGVSNLVMVGFVELGKVSLPLQLCQHRVRVDPLDRFEGGREGGRKRKEESE